MTEMVFLGERLRCYRQRWQNRLWRYTHPAGPDQDSAILINRELAGLDDFRFQIFEVGIIELELPLEGSISDPPMTLEEH